MMPEPREAKFPLRLGAYGFVRWAACYRWLGIDPEETFEIERRARGVPGFASTEYIIKGLKKRKNS